MDIIVNSVHPGLINDGAKWKSLKAYGCSHVARKPHLTCSPDHLLPHLVLAHCLFPPVFPSPVVASPVDTSTVSYSISAAFSVAISPFFLHPLLPDLILPHLLTPHLLIPHLLLLHTFLPLLFVSPTQLFQVSMIPLKFLDKHHKRPFCCGHTFVPSLKGELLFSSVEQVEVIVSNLMFGP